MKPDRWQQIERICEAALEQEPSGRAAFLEEACAGDETLRREVEDLLAQETKAEGFLEAPALEVEARAMARDQADPRLGQQVGSYEIVSLLGAGGMGEVYLARDATLGRKVALKFLPDFLQQEDTARKRFVREAKLAAALDHPFICKVYEIGEENERAFISLEYVRGHTLREKLAKGPLALREAWKIAAEIAEALAVAHQRGIVHRDLKPANLMFTPDGHVKVMDFGLAKQLIHDEGQEQSLTGMTKTGTTVGTLPYMSPEQVRGQKVDTRSDLFSLGVMLYEMLTGEHPFRRSLAADTAVAILGNEPAPVRELRPEVTEELESLVMKLLAKQQDDRWQSVEELRNSLAQLMSDPSSSSVVAAAGRGTALSRLASGVVVALVAVAAVVVAWLWFSRPVPDVLLKANPLTSLRGIEIQPSLSPDGSELAFAWSGDKQENFDIYVLQIDTGARPALVEHQARDTAPAWSPDRSKIAFLRDIGDGQAEIRVVPSRVGGLDTPVAPVSAESNVISGWQAPLAWTRDSQRLAVSARENSGEPTAIFLVSIGSGKSRPLTSPPLSAGGDVSPAFSPDDRMLAFVRRGKGVTSQIYLLPLTEDYRPAGKEEQLTRQSGTYDHPVWTPDGREIIFAFGAPSYTRLYRVPVSAPERMRALNLNHEAGRFPDVSSEGRLVYADLRFSSQILRVELPGPGARWGSAEWEPREFLSSTLSNAHARYSPDGKRIVFVALQSGFHEIWECTSDGADQEPLTFFDGPAVNAPRWSPDGEWISFSCPLEGNDEICVTPRGGGEAWRNNLTQNPASDRWLGWSGDSQWIYFWSDRSGEEQIWKIPAAGGQAERVTGDDGSSALESPDGESFFSFRVEDGQQSVWRIPVNGGEESLLIPTIVVPSSGFPSLAIETEGIYFFPDFSTLQFLSFNSEEATPVFSGLKKDQLEGLQLTSVSPDGRWALLNRYPPPESDLWLVEYFR